VKRSLVPLLCLALLGLAPTAARAAQCGVPSDDAARGDIAGWMAEGAEAAGLPGELPVMASLVDAGLHNISSGDADAVGYFAMRVAIWNSGPYLGFPDDPALQLQWFADQALAVKRQRIAAGDIGFGSDPAKWGEWIADVERPAEEFRGRYQLRLDEARQLIAAGCAGPDDPPVVTLAVAPAAGAGGWLNVPATVTVSATDDSAVANVACSIDGVPVALASGAFTVAGDGVHAVACTATDDAGNPSESATATVKIDRTAPLVAYTGNAGTYTVDATVSIACAASDALSGLAASTCAPVTGPAYRFAVGTNTFSASAADVAGNQATVSTSFVVRATVAGVCTLTTRFVQGSAAYAALRPAQRAAADRLAAALCQGLSALAPRLTPAQRAALIRAYQAGIAALVAPGWLTADQAATLRRVASALT
jgi:hypothetical protein